MELMILAAVAIVVAIVGAVVAVRADAAEAARETEGRRRLAAERSAAAAERAHGVADASDQIAALNHDVDVMVKGYCVQIGFRQQAEAALLSAIADKHAAELQSRFAATAAAAADAAAKVAAVKAALAAFDLTIAWGAEVDEQRAARFAAEAALAAAKAELRHAANLAAVRGCALSERRK